MLIDTHCHIHDANYPLDIGDILTRAHHAGINQMICVGTSVGSSKEALAFSARHEHIYASIGVHPHDTKEGWEGLLRLIDRQPDYAFPETASRRVPLEYASGGTRAADVSLKGSQPSSTSVASNLVAVGEIGLDYFYTHSPRETQIKALEWQIDLALRHNLPIIFHVREAFDDFWPIFDNFSGIRGELHSYTDSAKNLEEAVRRGLSIGVNGISTFTKDPAQKEMFAKIPMNLMLFETDAPFLTPAPLRGKVNEPAFVRHIAAYHAELRGVTLEEIASVTTANARALFALV